MKKIFLLLTLSLASLSFAQNTNYDEETSNLNWLTDFESAKKQSQETNKPILMYFTGSDWCGPCKLLKKDFFNSVAFEEKSENFILLMVDIPRKMDVITPEQKIKNKALVEQYNTKGSYPNLVALNSGLSIIGELSGYTFLRDTERHFAFVDTLIQKY